MCRIKANTHKKILSQNPVATDSIVLFDATFRQSRGDPEPNTIATVGYAIDKVKYWIATSLYDLTAEQIAKANKLCWNIKNFLAWWKRHLKGYHLIARSPYSLITYLLLSIYCHDHFQEKVSICHLRQLRNQIENELCC